MHLPTDWDFPLHSTLSRWFEPYRRVLMILLTVAGILNVYQFVRSRSDYIVPYQKTAETSESS